MGNSLKFNSLQRKRLYEEVADSIKQAIFAGDYEVGDKLPSEMELSGLFKVSRPVVREAIRYLELTGLVTVKQGATGGAFVSGMNSKILQENVKDLLVSRNMSVSQLTETRAHIDPEITRLAAVRANEKDLRKLEESILMTQGQAAETDYTKNVENNAEFHRLLGRASRNLFYSVIEDIIMDLTVEFILLIKPVEEVLHDNEEHRMIYQAILDKDPDRAVSITQKHIGHIGDQMVKLEKAYLGLAKEKKGLFLSK